MEKISNGHAALDSVNYNNLLSLDSHFAGYIVHNATSAGQVSATVSISDGESNGNCGYLIQVFGAVASFPRKINDAKSVVTWFYAVNYQS